MRHCWVLRVATVATRCNMAVMQNKAPPENSATRSSPPRGPGNTWGGPACFPSYPCQSLRQRAIRLLARREHTRVELARKLAPHGTPEEIEAVLTELARAGLQSDARFAESYVKSQAVRLGMSRLRQTLRTKGVDVALIESQLKNAELPEEMERATAVWTKKFIAPPADRREWAKQARFLQGRGFSSETIGKLLKEIQA